jgi:hypothetical protein
MTSGRSSPGLFGCNTQVGDGVDEYVVKLRGGLDTGTTGMLCELIASLLAEHLMISRPEPALVELTPDLAELIVAYYPSDAERIRKSIGLNFGSRHLTDVSIWPVGRPVPTGMRQASTEIFAFDSFIANDDRRYDNPNLFSRGDELLVFDHELAFAFLRLVGSSEPPWVVERRRSLTDHVFFLELKGTPVDLGDFSARLASLNENRLESMIDEVPIEWRDERLSRISAHITAIRDHTIEFAEQVKRRLV